MRSLWKTLLLMMAIGGFSALGCSGDPGEEKPEEMPEELMDEMENAIDPAPEGGIPGEEGGAGGAAPPPA